MYLSCCCRSTFNKMLGFLLVSNLQIVICEFEKKLAVRRDWWASMSMSIFLVVTYVKRRRSYIRVKYIVSGRFYYVLSPFTPILQFRNFAILPFCNLFVICLDPWQILFYFAKSPSFDSS